MTTEKLDCVYSNQKSFGGKAVVEYNDNGTKTLHSYRTVVARITPDKVVKIYTVTPSATTLKHIKEFLHQSRVKADNKKQIIADYAADRED